MNYDLAVASNDDTKTSGPGIDGKGDAIPAEMLPQQVHYDGAQFQLAPSVTGQPDAIIAKGQTIALPSGNYTRILILAASADQDQKAEFRVGDKTTELNVQSWSGFIGQWDNRIWKNQQTRNWAISANHAVWPPVDEESREARIPSPRYPEDYIGLEPGYIKPASLAWFASHHHTPEGWNEPYEYSYLFAYPIAIPTEARSLTLPNNDKIRILAISMVRDNPPLVPATPLFDTLGRAEPSSTAEGTAH